MSGSRNQAWLIVCLAACVPLVLAIGSLFGGRGVAAQGQLAPGIRQPSPAVQVEPLTSASNTPQPIQIQALDSTHFVVVTREARLTSRAGEDGPWQNMLLTVVTHYTVQNGRLVPIDHVRVPAGFRTLAP